MPIARFAVPVLAITVAASLGAAAADRRGGQGVAPHGPVAAEVSVCFVPEQKCDTPVVEAIGRAATFIRVQAYGFTSPVMLQALADARARGVDVQAILDKSDDRPEREGPRKPASGARFTVEAGIPTWIDSSVAIAHSKVIIIDGHLVIGGSYNYTASAERRNAENVTFIDAPVVADFYLVNWDARKAASRPSRYMAEEGPSTVASSGAR
jgi:phosphatidylserine/phosphatidylglycerophosphate/cardiolipin synthase-like enzyme